MQTGAAGPGRVREQLLDQRDVAILVGDRHGRHERLHRGRLLHPTRQLPGLAIVAPLLRIGRRIGYSGSGEALAVAVGDVSVGFKDEHRIIRSDLIQRLHGDRLTWHQRRVDALRNHPFARFARTRGGTDLRQRLGKRAGTERRHIHPIGQHRHRRVHMRVDEAWQQRPAVQVDHVGLAPSMQHDFLAAARGQNASLANRDGLYLALWPERMDRTAMEDPICRPCQIRRRRSGERCQR